MLIAAKPLVKDFLGLTFLSLLMLHSLPAAAGSYADSAHGNTTYGVEQTALPTYVQGNCGHCHEQHTAAADGFLLLADSFSGVMTNPYSESDSVCFYCHRTVGSIQTGGIINNNYSTTFGGATATTTSIMAAFNLDSYHNLYDVSRYITGASGTKLFSSFPMGSNPCSGCHNVHMAKANKRFPGDPAYTALSKPSEHENLWGDDTPTERMSSYGTDYQPPNYATGNLEPDGLSSVPSIQAAKTPDYNAFCTDCHNSINIIYSTTLGRNLRTIDWDNEKHGKGNADDSLSVDSPFTAGSGSLGYILACTDCHEPHGSSNVFLIRKDVNGAALSGNITAAASADWRYLCARCHDDSNETIHHFSADSPYIRAQCSKCHYAYPMRCSDCHFHGSWVNDPSNALDATPDYLPTTRGTF